MFIKNLVETIDYLKSAQERLGSLIEAEQRFYGDLALELLKHNWVLKQRPWSIAPGLLYVEYGFHSGKIHL